MEVESNFDGLTGAVSVRPRLDHHLETQALVLGGKTITSAGIAVACGVAQIGDSSMVKHSPSSTISKARNRIKHLLGRAIEDKNVSAVGKLEEMGDGLVLTPQVKGLRGCR